ncbi:MAG: M6 family metalloprotease domain-containing protein, partial [Saprospiraceae bacterium]|nr:M6 family metalloprotease domain-containing protein [Saprospiraceae bacterium]
MRTFIQPDGVEFEAYIRRNAEILYLETPEGYTILKDPSDGYFKYAVKGLDGDLFLSSVAVSPAGHKTQAEKIIAQQIDTHLRYSGKFLLNKQYEFNQAMTNAATIPSSVFPPTGSRKALLLLIKYPDQSNTYSVTNFTNLTNQAGYNFNGQTGSFKDFYKDISYNQLTINTDVFGWYTATNNRATYGDDQGSTVAINLVREAVDAAEANNVNFANYDGDGDGAVDVVMVIHSGRGAEESGDGNDIWSHRWSLSAASKAVTYDGKLINDYIIQAEKYGASSITNIGVLCHEFGHALGLPDLYDTDGSSSGLGRWCLMAAGNWNNDGKTPAHMSIWCKAKLGWINPTVLTGAGSVTNLTSLDASAQAFRINTPVADEYFLLENRQLTGWDASLPGDGLLIYHIDESQINNKNESRYLVNLEQADGLNHLNTKTNNGDTGDPFPGNSDHTTFNCYTTPNSNNYNGSSSNVNIAAIAENNGIVSFSYGPCQTCSGTPIGGSSESDVAQSCSGSTINLLLTGMSSLEGISYQWQSSTDGSNYTNVSGENEFTLQTTLQQTTWYRCMVTCQSSGQSSFSTSTKVDQMTGDQCYCNAGATEMQFEKISAIQFNDISNTSGSNADGYEDFTNIITAVSPGGTYSFNADIYNGFDQDQVFVWIDFNRDGDFDDPDELTFTSNTSAGPFTSMIAIPVTTTPGKTRMRIRLHDSG